jgi:NAD(P)-dependent dehydrogenase (short-subunit alcohol dehydrogenase family)
MSQILNDQRVLVIGGARDLGLAVAKAVSRAGATVIVGARDLKKAAEAAATVKVAEAVRIDVTDEQSIVSGLQSAGQIDHIIILTSAYHNVPVTQLDRDATELAFEAKVIGPMLVAKHAAGILPPTGSMILFSGVTAWEPQPGFAVTGITNGAVAFAASALARELAPIRVNAVSPGIIDSGSWDRLGPNKAKFLQESADATLVGRHGESQDVSDAVIWLLTAGFVTGQTIHVEGGTK